MSGGEATGKDSIALGGLSTATGIGAITLGNQNHATANGAIAIGHTTTATKDFSVAIGVRADATGKDSISMGKDTLADVDGSVAIGSNSVTEAATNVEGIYINGEEYKFAGGTPNSVVSFGTNGRDGGGKVTSYTRQLQNVAAGRVDSTSTDAVNGSQLNAVINALKFTTVADGENTNVSKTVNIDGGKEFSVNVNKDLYNMNSVNLNDGNNESSYTTKGIDMIYRGDGDTNGLEYKTSYKYNGIAIKINDGDANDIAKITLDENGLNNGGKKITNVARGTDPNDAVNVSQLTEINAANKSYVDSEVRKAGASAAALAALHPLEFNKDYKWQFATGFGNYGNKTAVALGAFYQPNENILLFLGTTLGGHNNMVNGGATFRFGHNSEMNTDKQIATDAKVQELENRLKAMEEKYNELLQNQNK